MGSPAFDALKLSVDDLRTEMLRQMADRTRLTPDDSLRLASAAQEVASRYDALVPEDDAESIVDFDDRAAAIYARNTFSEIREHLRTLDPTGIEMVDRSSEARRN